MFGARILVFLQTLQQKLLDYPKFQSTIITNFIVITVIKKNTHFVGGWFLSWSRRMSVAGSCSCWRIKKLQSSSKNRGDFSYFSCVLVTLCFCFWYKIFHLVSYGIKILLWKLQWKLKAKRVLLNARVFLSWTNPAIKAEEFDAWWDFLQDFQREFYCYPWIINKGLGWKVIYSKYNIHYFHHFFLHLAMQIMCPLGLRFPQVW